MVHVTRLAHVGLQAHSLSTQATADLEPGVKREQITDPDRQPRVMEPYPDQWRSASSH